MDASNGQKTEISRACQGPDANDSGFSDRKTGRDGQKPGDEQVGIGHSVRVGRNLFGRMPGGILAQLIAEQEDQLGDAIRGIADLEKKIGRIQRRLDELKNLQALMDED